MDELKHLLVDWPHWAFEAISDAVFVAIGWAIARPNEWFQRKIHKHDREVHNHDDT